MSLRKIYGGGINLEEQREESVLRFINSILEIYDNIEELIFFEFNGNKVNGDIEIIKEFNEKINKKVKTRIVRYTFDTEKICTELNKCDFLVGIRLHSGILAYALDIPFMLIEYHTKCTEFLNTINHNYRFYIDNHEKNLENFNMILKNKCVPNIKEPIYFKNILIKELRKIEKIM